MSAQQLADRALLNLGRGLKEHGYRFITPTPLTHERVYQRLPTPLAVDLRDVFGWSMPFDNQLLPEAFREELQQADVIEKHDALWRSAVRWSSLDDLLLAHSAYPTTQSDAVFFGPDSYRFAHLLEAHLQQRGEPITRAVDIGCGAGVGALVVARARPDAEVLAVDINPRALRLTAVNAELAGLANVSAYHSDVLGSVEGEFDLIVANPPYMNDDRQRAYRHGGGALGEQLSVRIASESLGRLALGGSLVLYTGVAIVAGEDPFLAAVKPLLASDAFGWTYRELDPDVFGEELGKPGYERVERIAVVALTVTRLR
ncbi:methyltransferase domain-containing protein [Pseudomonas aylmerensis]|jgi:SAM-dependent methyltransferase|uniref:Methyltransferase domain-containing protein n=1 Tax=Pseudomonas aylmerensis TaxID=1869229 RepID=A0A2T4FX33_9PSED|nr:MULTISPECIES: class I SAM-dependent methyltransferase [Pseudomonas]AYF49427.1 class I SAM-dependent methyltransferase [Pseudomonas fluorescens]MBK5477858.1 class I SAM-dependent methyltransferase [Pseudomonas sp. TH21]OCW22915.1 SAM-dependent methyltransferase [Pseudomonas aylmerensis]PTC27925.1 methyltransferase domain-containing protein [Pseudomonas aylmerensis]QTV16506.1 class I SAM-dependent methyltransferase [Pseudomonas fluorescens]